jgi:Zn-dependent protease
MNYANEMPSMRSGAIRLGNIAGINLYLHWSWFLVAVYEIQGRRGDYSSVAWNIAEYLTLFLIVLTHEFGHALATRSVGGTANQILLWPFGGVAYVSPPQRPGATLWAIAAGPLVNVALAPLLIGAVIAGRSMGWSQSMPDLYQYLWQVLRIDLGLLIFNMLPIYPLDGGQILRSLLWFVLGRGKSLLVATVVGFLGLAALIVDAVLQQSLWTGLIALYLLLNCWNGLQHARALLKLEKLPRRPGFACPSCRTAPLIGEYWRCQQCQQVYDTFATAAVCPQCGARSAQTTCVDCRQSAPISEWAVGAHTGSGVVSSSFEMK